MSLAAMASLQPLPPGYAVIGIIGPDSPGHREALRAWTRAVAPAVSGRFAVSLRDRALQPWWEGMTRQEADVDLLDCLGQRSGAGVVILSLFDTWLRFAVARFPEAAFVGRADSDAIPSPSWLLAMLTAEANRQAALRSDSDPLVYVGSMQWYNWGERTARFRCTCCGSPR